MLTLRVMGEHDLGVVDAWFADRETQRWLGGTGWSARALALADGVDRIQFVAEDGGVAVVLVDVDVVDCVAGFAFTTRPDRRGRGLAADAVRLVVEHPALAHAVMWRAGVEDGNTTSESVLARVGLVTDGCVDDEGFRTFEAAAVALHARHLLGRVLHGHGVAARITEVEAYGGIEDPASHGFTRTPRSEIMYGPPWRLYVYRSYGIHHCVNVVTGPTAQAAAVLVRAGEIVHGEAVARERRGMSIPDAALGRGPGNLARVLGLGIADLGSDLTARSGVRLDDRRPIVHDIACGPRVGVSKAVDVPWRFWLAGDPTVSTYRRSPRAARALDE